ncbi:hypothetical protein HK105_200723 [Polyrhizophydium stewartii]|uniref:Borealin C-terminal domain-containing protein n=1 Tax=Polyrhizophydium stewartii TaxID=2732419 RepID=A0ABR4NJU6_9FUNG
MSAIASEVQRRRAALEQQAAAALELLERRLDEHIACFPAELQRGVTLRQFLEQYGGSIERFVQQSSGGDASADDTAAASSDAVPEKQPGDAEPKHDEQPAPVEGPKESAKAAARGVPRKPAGSRKKGEAASVPQASDAAGSEAAGDVTGASEADTDAQRQSGRRSRKKPLQELNAQDLISADAQANAQITLASAATARGRKAKAAGKPADPAEVGSAGPAPERASSRRMTRAQSMAVSQLAGSGRDDAAQVPPTPAFSKLLPETPAATRLRRPRRNETLLSTNGSPLAFPAVATGRRATSRRRGGGPQVDDGDDGDDDDGHDDSFDFAEDSILRGSFTGRRITLRSQADPMSRILTRASTVGGAASGAAAGGKSKGRTKSRDTLAAKGKGKGARKEDAAQGGPLSASARVLLQLGDGTVLDLDPAITGDDVKRELNDEQRTELANHMISMRSQLEGLLGSMGIEV